MNNGDRPINPIENHDLAVDIATVGYSDFSGMTKRELMAVHAMQGILANPEWSYGGFSGLARLSTEAADALLKELDKPVREGE